jgi:acyl-CoA synthetase (AMP-forming)/AMP-acid ligase II
MERFDHPDVIFTDVMRNHAKWRKNKTALICNDQRMTWGEFNDRINRLANGLIRLGLRKGDKVSMLMTNSIEMVEIIFGTIKAGGVIVPLSSMVTGDALTRMINNSDSKFLFVGSHLIDVIAPHRSDLKNIADENFFSVGADAQGWRSYRRFIEENSAREVFVDMIYEDPFNIMYTSGTTGLPKGILHTHHNRFQFAAMFAIDFRIDSSARNIVATSLYANGTWLTFLPTMFVGGTVIIMPQYDATGCLALIQKEKCTHTFMVPTQFKMLLDHPDFDRYDLNSMKVWLAAGSPFLKQDKEQVLKRFPGELMELWGLTEGVGTTLKPEDMDKKTSSIGIPPLGWDVGIIDEEGKLLPPGEIGEIIGLTPWLMPEYYKLPDKTAEAIWRDERGKTFLKTGDMGKLDDDGFLYILDRKKDMIISGGINIFASDIEEVLAKHPDVQDCTVIGIPHEKWGETPLALVILYKGAKVSEADLKQWLNGKVAKYQRVSGLVCVEDFPRNAMGKVLKKELRKEYSQ